MSKLRNIMEIDTDDEELRKALQTVNTKLPFSDTQTPESKLDALFNSRMKSYEEYKKKGEEELIERDKQRKQAEGEKDLGSVLGTLLGHALSGGDTQRTSYNYLPTAAEISKGEISKGEVSKGELVRQALGKQEHEDFNVALKNYYDYLIKGMDHFKALELERTKQEGRQANEFVSVGDEWADEQGNLYVNVLNKKTGTLETKPLGKKGKPPGALTPKEELQERLKIQNEQNKAIKETSRLNKKFFENEKMIERLKTLDPNSKEDELTLEQIMSGYRSSNPSWGYVKSKDQLISVLKKEQISIDEEINYWKEQARHKPKAEYYKIRAEYENRLQQIDKRIGELSKKMEDMNAEKKYGSTEEYDAAKKEMNKLIAEKEKIRSDIKRKVKYGEDEATHNPEFPSDRKKRESYMRQ